MKFVIWKAVYKIICRWEDVAFKNGLSEQVDECRQIQRGLMHYKNVMQEKGICRVFRQV